MGSNVLDVEVVKLEVITEEVDCSCPICGQLIDIDPVTQFVVNYEKHRCPMSVLRRMESKDTQPSNHISDNYIKDLYCASRVITDMLREY